MQLVWKWHILALIRVTANRAQIKVKTVIDQNQGPILLR